MEHSYLFEEATWTTSGFYIGESGKKVRAEGRSIITHQPDIWIIQGTMKIYTESAAELGITYQVRPFREGSDATPWSSMNDALGRIDGQFIVVDDSILSFFQTPGGKHRGSEYLRCLDEDRYLSRGALFRGHKKASSWMMELGRMR